MHSYNASLIQLRLREWYGMNKVSLDGGREVWRWRLLRWISYRLRVSSARERERNISEFFDVEPDYISRPEKWAKRLRDIRWATGLEA